VAPDLAPRRETERRAIVTYLLVVLNVFVFFFGPAMAAADLPVGTSTSCARVAFNAQYGAVPKELTQNQQLPQERRQYGDANACPTPTFTKSSPLSALTSLFVHASWMHLLGNMVMLLVFAGRVEKRLGAAGFTVLYLVSGYTAAYGFAFSDPGSLVPLVGASGAIAGVAGAYLWMYPRERLMALAAALFLIPLPIPLLGVSSSAAGQVAWQAHLVGFAAGLLLAMAYVSRGAVDSRPPRPAPTLVNRSR
jgi:membrane associated rhomboid family serine protease